jgi:hypothetical protein
MLITQMENKMTNTITANNVEFNVIKGDDMYFLEAATPLHHATWKKCVRELDLEVKVGDWTRGNIGTYDIDKVKSLLYKEYVNTLSVEELIDNIVGDTPTIQDIVEETA